MIETLKNNRLILGILGVILLVIILGALAAALMPASSKDTAEAKPIAPTEAPTNEANTTQVEAVPEEDLHTDNFAPLVDETLIEQPIPEDQALVKDELVQLNDIDSQLNEQAALLEQQHQDVDELIKLKEQQIAQLEQQLAQD